LNQQQYYAGTGRRKCAVARVRLYAGGSGVIINDKPMEEIFNRPAHTALILKPLLVTEQQDKYKVQIKVQGGGISAWAGAIAHGIARALLVSDESFRKPLRSKGLLTRDARVKERKKYGLKRARKAPQYTKR